MCGRKSSRPLRLTAAYAVPASKCDASSILMVLQTESADGVTFFQVAPASFVNWIFPSSLPTQIRPSLTGDGAMVRMAPGRLLGIFRVDGSAGEVGTDDLPTGASVGGLQEELRAEVQEVGILGGEDHRDGPVKMIFAAQGNRGRRNIANLAGGLGEADDAAEGTGVVDDVGIEGIGNGVAAFSGADGRPLALGDLAVVAAAGD